MHVPVGEMRGRGRKGGKGETGVSDVKVIWKSSEMKPIVSQSVKS